MRPRLLTAAALASSVLPLAACEQAADMGGPAPALASSRVLDVALCDPSNGGFTAGATNPWFPIVVGQQWEYEGEDDGAFVELTITVLAQTEVVAGITTRVVHEHEVEDGVVLEDSWNYFAQAADGTVCYFGEAVDIYHPDGSVTHEGAWRADDGPDFAPGIMMPADPQVGDRFQMEVAPEIAEDEGRIVGTGGVTVPAGPFPETIRVREFNPLDAGKGYKVFAHGVGLVIDGGVELTDY
ncbi:MAG TPA: hypothetical protein VJ773_05550 [Gemmatimonadales bacterium]|nr:hypothetical protein [Gemmatimonadales bacterium]